MADFRGAARELGLVSRSATRRAMCLSDGNCGRYGASSASHQCLAREWNAVNSCHAEGLGGNSIVGVDEELLACVISRILFCDG